MADRKRLRDLPMRTVVSSWLFLALLVAYFMPKYSNAIVAQLGTNAWPSALATVIESHVDGIPLSRHQTLHFEFQFQTEAGLDVVASRRTVGFLARPCFSKRWFASDHPVGSSLKVWYDPQQPTRTTISQGVSFFDAIVGVSVLVAFAVLSHRAGMEVWRRILRLREHPRSE